MSASEVSMGVPLAGSYTPLPSSGNGGNPNVGFTGIGSDSRFTGPGGNHIFCGCCCDTRRATLIINGISVVMKFITMILLFVGVKFIEKNYEQIEADMSNDEDRKQFDLMVHNGTFELFEGFTDLFLFFSMLMHICGIYGALKFKPWAIIVAAVAYGLGLLLALLSMSIFQIVFMGLFLYPHIILLKEIQSGIMSEMNYEHVVHCCGSSGGGGGYV